jgi:hypothetical protein
MTAIHFSNKSPLSNNAGFSSPYAFYTIWARAGWNGQSTVDFANGGTDIAAPTYVVTYTAANDPNATTTPEAGSGSGTEGSGSEGTGDSFVDQSGTDDKTGNTGNTGNASGTTDGNKDGAAAGTSDGNTNGAANGTTDGKNGTSDASKNGTADASKAGKTATDSKTATGTKTAKGTGTPKTADPVSLVAMAGTLAAGAVATGAGLKLRNRRNG